MWWNFGGEGQGWEEEERDILSLRFGGNYLVV